MSNTPPTEQSIAANPGGDGIEITPTNARTGQRTGRVVWILGVSMAAIIIIFAIFLISNARHLSHINRSGGAGMSAHDVNTYQTPGGSARQDPSGQVGKTGN